MDWYSFFPILLCTLYFYMTIFHALTKNEKLLNSKCLLKFLCTWIRFANKQVESLKWISTDILSWWLKKKVLDEYFSPAIFILVFKLSEIELLCILIW